MPTSNVVVVASGTSFATNVTALNLSTDLTQKDFIVLKNGIPDTLSNYSKASATAINYNGVLLVSASLEFRRATPVSVVSKAAFGTRIRSEDWNNELDRISRRAEEYALNGVGAGSLVSVATPQNDPFGSIWQFDTLFPASRKALYDKLITLADIASPTFTGVVTLPSVLDADSSLKAATTLFVKNNLVSYAPLASPTFSGTPVLPSATVGVTQTAGDNTTKLSTTAFVQTTLTSGLSLYAPLAAPALTGNPTAPTQAINNNSTRLATTAYVNTSNRPAVNATRTTSQTIPIGALTTILFNSVVVDTNSIYAPGTGQMTIPTGLGGLYIISSSIVLASAVNTLILDIIVNGAIRSCLFDVRIAADTLLAATGSGPLSLVSGDVVEIQLYQASVALGSRNLQTTAPISNMSMFRLNT